MRDYQRDFILPEQAYLLSHSVGRPLASARTAFEQAYFSPWQDSGREPWGDWLAGIEGFRGALAKLFHANIDDFCPQSNLSSALVKLLMSHPRLSHSPVILMAEQDFPSMGFAVQQALPNARVRFIPNSVDLTDANQWQSWLTADVDLVFISHVYSNTGECAPVVELAELARRLNVLSLVDIAQSAGVIPLNLTQLNADFVIGSSVKWLCGGPGAGYLWVNPQRTHECTPKDVGWFSHENPFEFDIHHFKYHPGALRFWGGTPSVAPFLLAAHSIEYFAGLGVETVRAHNQSLLDMLHQHIPELMVSPTPQDKRSGTGIISTQDNAALLGLLSEAGFSLDLRRAGLRVSPHIYTGREDMERLIECISRR